MAYGRSGFTPLGQVQPQWIRNCAASCGGNQTISKGDAVCEVNGIIVPATAGQDPAQFGYGIVLAVYTTANRPFTFNNTKYIASGLQGRADVCYDPNQAYTVQCVTSIGASNLGKNLILDVSAANSQLGISGHSVDIPVSASVNDLFKLISISPYDEVTGGGKDQGGGTNNGAVVRWNNQFLRATKAGQ